jgi:hypothetical protein
MKVINVFVSFSFPKFFKCAKREGLFEWCCKAEETSGKKKYEGVKKLTRIDRLLKNK